jgi:hypothetical protein
MLVGGYLYKRIDYMLEFAGAKDHSDLQLGGTLDEVEARRDLFEWECLMMSVDYRGFHSPWNKKASNAKMNGGHGEWTVKQQAQYVKTEVEKHKRCIESATHRNAYWLTHAKPIILERDLFRWTCETYKQRKVTYNEAQRLQRYPTQQVGLLPGALLLCVRIRLMRYM